VRKKSAAVKAGLIFGKLREKRASFSGRYHDRYTLN
jgi:hypothetical protein